MNEPQINITVMPGAQMNGYVKEQHNYYGPVQKIESNDDVKATPIAEAEEIKATAPNQPATNNKTRDEELTFLLHPSVDSKQEWQIHDEICRLVKRQGIQEICQYLWQLKNEQKVLLPQVAEKAYKELVRLGMPHGDGYSLKTFMKYYKR